METAGCLRLVAVAAAFWCAAWAVPAGIGTIHRARVADRANRFASEQRTGFAARLLRNGIAPATVVAQALCRRKWIASYLEGLAWLARHHGFETDACRAGGVALALALASGLAGWLVSSSPLFGAMAAACLAIGAGIAARQAREREMEEMRESLPAMLRTMSACFHAGYSLLQAFRHLAHEVRGPLGHMLQRAAGDLETGHTAHEALERMRRDSSLRELSFVAAALEIQHQTGGSLQKVMDSACESIEGELALKRMLRVQTAQARLSMRVITIMPFILMAVFSLVSPGFLVPFFSSVPGVALFCVAMGMQLAGVLIIRRMLDVREA